MAATRNTPTVSTPTVKVIKASTLRAERDARNARSVPTRTGPGSYDHPTINGYRTA